MTNQNKNKAPQTGTLGKLMAIMDVVATSPEPLRFTELLQQVKQPRGSVHRQITHLLEEGLLTQHRDGSYELGIRLLQLASHAWNRNSLRLAAEPHLRTLQQQTGETVHLAVLRDAKVVYLDKVESSQSVRMHSQIGNTSPIYCTGVGKAMLAALPDADIETLLPRMDFHRYTEHTLSDAAAMREEVRQIRAQSYAEDREEHEIGIRCVAAPVTNADGEVICGISATAPIFRLQPGQLDDWSRLVIKTARDIGECIVTQMGPRR